MRRAEELKRTKAITSQRTAPLSLYTWPLRCGLRNASIRRVDLLSRFPRSPAVGGCSAPIAHTAFMVDGRAFAPPLLWTRRHVGRQQYFLQLPEERWRKVASEALPRCKIEQLVPIAANLAVEAGLEVEYVVGRVAVDATLRLLIRHPAAANTQPVVAH
eukprot:scaffold67739_cov33-Phaeocystis_antarctica.AAC.1